MEMSRSDKVVALGLAAVAALMAVAALAVPAKAASYGNGFQLSKFKVEIEGYSNTTWHRNIEAANECEVSDHSFGRERLNFATTKPIVIMASHMPGEFNPSLFAGRSALGVPVKAKIQRSFTPAISAPAKECEDNGGGAEATVPDCGTRTVKSWHVNVEFSDKKRDGLQVHGDGGVKIPYAGCPGAGFTFPFLLDEEGTREARKPLYASLSQDEIFDPEFRKWITLGNGTWTETDETWTAKTDVHWALSFTRLQEKSSHR
ncbi:MAG TPA: hypothetical protein VMS11_02460 [Solirubrobacterales bacterium]|nr:hypothetical protein [Solirubrobacterales bacterium]